MGPVTAINPASGVNTTSTSITSVTGTNFVSGATVKFTKSGQSDISCTGFSFTSSSTLSSGSCPITSVATGAWNVVVTNPDTQTGILTNGFTVNDSTLRFIAECTGGSKTYSGGYTIHTFTGSGTFSCGDSGTVEALVVAAGGGGGGHKGGGGGAGGLVYHSGKSLLAGNYSVTIGGGGGGGVGHADGSNGG